MASQGRGSSPTIKKELFSRPFEFSFFQVVRLLKLFYTAELSHEENSFSKRNENPIRVRPELTLAFPAADVTSIESRDEEDRSYEVTATFLGLYGSSSPLPTFYTEDLLAEASDDETVTRDFLDILNQHLYDLLYKCWAKYRLYVTVAEERDANHTERLFCLLGLGEPQLRDEVPSTYGMLRYLGLVTQHPRSALGLKTLLSDALGGFPVKVEPCSPRYAPIPEDQRACLGVSGSTLGKDTFLGSEILDHSGKFRVVIGPLARKDFLSLLPGSNKHHLLAFLTKFYLSSPLEWDIKLTMPGEGVEPVRLGDPEWGRLGWTTWVFSGKYEEEACIVFQPEIN